MNGRTMNNRMPAYGLLVRRCMSWVIRKSHRTAAVVTRPVPSILSQWLVKTTAIGR